MIKRFTSVNLLLLPCIAVAFLISKAQAQQLIPQTRNQSSPQTLDRLPGIVFYTYSESTRKHFNFMQLTLEDINLSFKIQTETNRLLPLLNWVVQNRPAPAPPQKFDRFNHFGPWLKTAKDNFCLNTRAFVLMRDSQRPTTRGTVDPCVIDQGLWKDPYTNQVFDRADKLQIDHVVALKNSYISGAFTWDWKTRCSFANYMGYKNHLIAVFGPENNSKSDKAPDEYIPPNPQFVCEYLKTWLQIKVIWKLWMSPTEYGSIVNAAKKFRCDQRLFVTSTAELQQQRKFIGQMRNMCPNSPNDIPQNNQRN